MPNLAYWAAFEYPRPNGGTMGMGQLDAPSFVVPSVGATYENDFQVAQNAIQKIFDATVSIADFTFACIVSDTGDPVNGYVMLELVTDNAGIVHQTPFTVPLAAGLPFFLFGSTSYAGYVVNFGGGTLEKINLMRVKNLNSNQANVSVWMVN